MINTITQSVGEYERILTLIPPVAKRSEKDVHGLDLRMAVRRNNRSVVFVAIFPVHLPKVTDHLLQINPNAFKGFGTYLSCHSPTPMYHEQAAVVGDCPYTGGECYCDGTASVAEEYYDKWLEEGIDAVWKLLEEYWVDTFWK